MVDTCWENERHIFGLGWRVPALLERPRWSTARGEPLQLAAPPAESEGWTVKVDPTTDSEGWQYASVFKHFDYTRPGGRAMKRAGDFVRRRCWSRTEQAGAAETGAEVGSTVERGAAQMAVAAEAVATSLISPVTQMQGTRVRKQTESERRKTAMRVFMNMLTATVKRRQLWTMMPFDPGAWVVLLQKHQADLEAHQALQAVSAPSALPPLLHSTEVEENSGQEGNLVRDLLCAAVHSRAAYGFAMSAGHLSSIYNFAMMHTVHQFSFDAAGGASGAANNEAVAALAGIPLADLRMSEWSNSVMRPCHYVAVDRANHCVVLSIRGSLEVGDVLSDLTANPLELFGLVGVEGLAHEGMMAAATYVQCNTAPALEVLAKELPGWPLFITGHSMGGGVATILALLMKEGAAPEGLGPIKCIVVGPAPVLSRPLAEACNPFVTSVVLGADVVPRVSYASVETAFLELVNASPVRTAAATLAAAGQKVSEGIKGLNAGINAGIKATLKPPARPALPVLPGLRSILNLLDDKAATEAAAHAAELASAAEETPEAGEGASIDRGDCFMDDAPPSPAGRSAQASRHSQEIARNLAYTIQGVTSSVAGAAAARLAALQAESAEQASLSDSTRAAAAAPGSSGDTEPKPGAQDGGQEGVARAVGTGSRAGADYQTAGEVLGAGKKEFQDASGHPEPLYVGGRVLWVIPAAEIQAGSGASESAAQASPEVEMVTPSQGDDDLPTRLDQMHADDVAWFTSRKASLAGAGAASGNGSARSGEGPGAAARRSASRFPGSARLVSADEEAGGQLAGRKRSASFAAIPAVDLGRASSDGWEVDTANLRDASREFPSLAVTEECSARYLSQGVQQTEGPLFPSLAIGEEPSDARLSNESTSYVQEGSMAAEDGIADCSTGPEGSPSAPKKARSGDHKATERRGPAVLDVPRETFDRILLTMEMITDHLPDSYLAAIQQM